MNDMNDEAWEIYIQGCRDEIEADLTKSVQGLLDRIAKEN